MSDPAGRLVAVGRIGRAHGRDGAFYVEGPTHPLAAGTAVLVAGRETRVEHRGGTDERPLVRLSDIGDRSAAAQLRGEALLVPEAEAPLGEGEWLVEDLVGCRIDRLGQVRRVLAGPSCDLLEVGQEGILVPLVADAVRSVDLGARTIEIDRRFLGLEGGPAHVAPGRRATDDPPASPGLPADPPGRPGTPDGADSARTGGSSPSPAA